MRYIKYVVISFLIVVLFNSCAEWKSMMTDAKSQTRWIGRTANDIIMTYGAPDREASDGSDGTIIIYEDFETVRKSSVKSNVRYYHPEEKPNLDHCAEMTLMSRRKLTDLFREVTGLSVGDYRDLIRLEESKKLLDDPSLSVSDIAETLGFGSISSFSAFFKQQCGFSPSRYRRSQAQP